MFEAKLLILAWLYKGLSTLEEQKSADALGQGKLQNVGFNTHIFKLTNLGERKLLIGACFCKGLSTLDKNKMFHPGASICDGLSQPGCRY